MLLCSYNIKEESLGRTETAALKAKRLASNGSSAWVIVVVDSARRHDGGMKDVGIARAVADVVDEGGEVGGCTGNTVQRKSGQQTKSF